MERTGKNKRAIGTEPKDLQRTKEESICKTPSDTVAYIGLPPIHKNSALRILDINASKHIKTLETLCEDLHPDSITTPEAQELYATMFNTMYLADGIGLAAPQIGLNLNLFVCDVNNNPQVIINPQWETLYAEADHNSTEGCLSCPGIEMDMERPQTLGFFALNEQGVEQEFEGTGIQAACYAHELDHLRGILIIDRLSDFRRREYRLRMAKLKKKARRIAKNLRHNPQQL